MCSRAPKCDADTDGEVWSPSGATTWQQRSASRTSRTIVVPNQGWRRPLQPPQSAQRSLAALSFPFSLQTLLSRLLALLLPVRIQPPIPTFRLFRFLRIQASPLRDAFHWSVLVVLDQSPFRHEWKIRAPGELSLQ